MKVRRLTPDGSRLFREWLEAGRPGDSVPAQLLDSEEETEILLPDRQVDPALQFESRLDFGHYLVEVFNGLNAQKLLAEANDGLWDWLTVVYFSQVGLKQSKYWHYVVTRRGHSGSLAYRHLVRTSFEMYARHGDNAKVMLSTDLSTWGDMSEQLTSRQDVAYHHGFIAAAAQLYMREGKLRRGAASRLKPPHKRKKGDRSGRGNVARLALAVRRLGRTFDTHEMPIPEMIQLLPKEFSYFLG